MKVKALKVIRSSHLSPDTVKPGDVGEILSTNIDLTGRKLFKVRWANGMEGVVLPTDVEFMESVCDSSSAHYKAHGERQKELETGIVAAPAATVSPSTARSEAASSSRGQLHPVLLLDGPGQEPVGNLPHFCFTFRPSWWSESYFELGGEG